MMKNRWIFVLLMPLFAMLFVACDDGVSYSEMKDRERDAINDFIMSEGISVISKSEFIEQDSITNIDNNEYVLLDNVYVQFVKNPNPRRSEYGNVAAKKIADGTSMNLLIKYTEYAIMDEETFSSNHDKAAPDEMTVVNDGGNYSASFASGVMHDTYGTTAVPTGWLVAMPYLYFTRSQANLAEINIIVPHTEGTSMAATYVYPCFYNIKFQPE
ncbi:MAG: DUF4827 domain-containing protein [Bacteroidaceae bacterium]|nr:DUF4827 domain-containing protein [Bacteroidaceae bacterium]